jgi:DNA-binding CsgD family transcriptional regulator/hypothetical membrane protein
MLTPREEQVLTLVASGATNDQIAGRLGIAVKTVERHVTHVYRKVGAGGRADATRAAVALDLVSAGTDLLTGPDRPRPPATAGSPAVAVRGSPDGALRRVPAASSRQRNAVPRSRIVPGRTTTSSTVTADRERLDHRRLGLAGLVAPAVLVLGVVAASLTWPGYDHRTQNISDLGGIDAPSPVLLNATLVLFGGLVGAFSVALRQAGAARVGPLLVGSFGLAAVVQGFTPCTAGCAEGTGTDLIHVVAATTGFLAFAVALLSYARGGGSDAGGSSHRAWSAWLGWLTLGFLVAWFVAAGVDPERLHAGLLQRSLVAVVLLWLTVTAVSLLRTERAPQAAGDPGRR